MRLLSKYVAAFVYGAFDGIVTTFAVVAAASGAGLASNIVIILGLANLIADGFSMGASAYLSGTAETQSKKKSPYKTGLATFSAFLFVGIIPVAPYLFDVLSGLHSDKNILFGVSTILTVLAFFVVGIAKAKASGRSIRYSVFETLLLGVVAGVLAYLAGDFLEAIFNVH